MIWRPPRIRTRLSFPPILMQGQAGKRPVDFLFSRIGVRQPKDFRDKRLPSKPNVWGSQQRKTPEFHAGNASCWGVRRGISCLRTGEAFPSRPSDRGVMPRKRRRALKGPPGAERAPCAERECWAPTGMLGAAGMPGPEGTATGSPRAMRSGADAERRPGLSDTPDFHRSAQPKRVTTRLPSTIE